MSVRAFIRTVESVEDLGSETYRITVSVNLMDNSHSVGVVAFDAPWGSDWRLLCRTAVEQWALSDLGETVHGVVMPGLETI